MNATSVRRFVERHPAAALAAVAILLRLIAFTGRGHYVAFDEGWYLLLGRNLWRGAGYTLSGLEHVTLSPLFPILAGALDRVIGDAVWAGRILAAVTGGLLALPCWSIFRRLGGLVVAWPATLFVVTMPALAPFVAPYWIGWELWAGAEPVLHLFAFTGVAFFLAGWQDRRVWPAAASGLSFGLAYLARPEALALFGLLGVCALVLALATRRSWRPLLLQAATYSIAFLLAATPYWVFLHDRLDRWTISGRGVHVSAAMQSGEASHPSSIVDRMLWEDDDDYLRALYSLDASGVRLASDYWGVPRDAGGPATAEVPASATAAPDTESATPAPADDARRAPEAARATADSDGDGGGVFRAPIRYVRALAVVVPWFLWPFVALGLFLPRERPRPDEELLFALPLVATGLLIAALVAIDPRTQLFLAPLAAWYAARGTVATGAALHARLGRELRLNVAIGLVAGTLALVLVGISARRVYLGLAVGSPHHIVGAENAAVGELLRDAAPAHAPVMSWHPALALFADRDWRVLPFEPLDRIIGFARTQDAPLMVLSVYYPPPILRGDDAPHYLVVPIPADLPRAERYRIDMTVHSPTYATGVLRPQP